jgi:hypothetical protein
VLARYIWNQVVPHITAGSLANIRLVQSRDLSFDYSA